MNGPGAQRVRGFTLMELLVVLVITALLMSMLFQSLGIFRRAQERVDVRTVSQRQVELVARWYGDSVAGLFPLDTQSFSGDETHWQGITLQPVQGTPGAPTPVTWTLRSSARGSTLEYVSRDHPAMAFPIQEASPTFAYADESGEIHRRWPPAKGLYAALPSAVLLQDGAGDAQVVVRYSPVLGPLQPYFEPFELEPE